MESKWPPKGKRKKETTFRKGNIRTILHFYKMPFCHFLGEKQLQVQLDRFSSTVIDCSAGSVYELILPLDDKADDGRDDREDDRERERERERWQRKAILSAPAQLLKPYEVP